MTVWVVSNLSLPACGDSVNQTGVIRWDYGGGFVGTCLETLEGGNHFRYWQQSGSDADSGAWFLA